LTALMRSAVGVMMLTWAMACLGVPQAFAHRMNAALSVIEVNRAGNTIDVTHRLYAHDLEHALDLGSAGIGYFESPAGKLALRDYTLAQFALSDERGRPLDLTFVGTEISGDLVFVYFSGRLPRGAALLVDSNLLQDFFESQINQVNLRVGGQTRSAVFPAGQTALRMALGRAR
jgi:hypothetical protein